VRVRGRGGCGSMWWGGGEGGWGGGVDSGGLEGK
jgi:hypothetical protein